MFTNTLQLDCSVCDHLWFEIDLMNGNNKSYIDILLSHFSEDLDTLKEF